ncbi:MAG: hypothetical protein QOK16_4363 [Solirubrobacteraceae bacterium]|jgi:hypothetical protein|nr:hypothetical protein [Solirubrobacteraceae bacterium]MEA2189352.1 hypothetical protein [Solirubrobacteraceae bacterium]
MESQFAGAGARLLHTRRIIRTFTSLKSAAASNMSAGVSVTRRP